MKNDPWTVLGLLGGQIPGVSPVAHGIARNTVQRLLGFYVLWHIFGGQQALMSSGAVSTSSCYRQMHEFRHVFGCDVQDWCPELARRIAEMLDEEQEDATNGRG